MKPRPSFPAKLPPPGGQSAASLSPPAAQINPRPTTGQGTRQGRVNSAAGPASPLSSTPVSSGLGLDSGAVRARMVAKLAEQGVQDPWVLQAMGQVERHRFVETALAGQAYEDTSLPIGLGQTISKPNVVARMIELPNVHLMLGDGMLGFPKGAPYAGIISAAGGDEVPSVWLDQLAVGAKLVAPTVTASGHQALVVIRRTATGFDRQVLEAVHFVPLKSGIA